MADLAPYRVAMLDWLACATAGAGEPAARAARAAGVDAGVVGRVAFAATAGHVLDFDDTFLEGLAHLSAPTAPAALVLAAELDRPLGDALHAHAPGFEAMGALAAAGHPALYDGGWHPTAVCGSLGAAVAAAALLELDQDALDAARALALLGAGGLRAGFGSDGKALGVGAAAGNGVRAAQLAAAGAQVPRGAVASGTAGYEEGFGAPWAEPDARDPAVAHNWIKAFPCCLQTHGAIEAAAAARAAGDGAANGPVEVTVHPVSRRAAPYDDVADGLQAKFSIPYTTAFTLLHGPPGVADFAAVDPDARALAKQVTVRTDGGLRESEAAVAVHGREAARVLAARGSPERPIDATALAAKVHGLAGDRLDGLLDDPTRPAREVLAAAGL